MLRGTLVSALLIPLPLATGIALFAEDKRALPSQTAPAAGAATTAKAEPAAATPAPAPAAAPAKPAAAAPAAPAPKPAAKPGEEIVFDPSNPPAGYFNCHRNHCHKSDGTVASYQRVMEEMGATKVAGGIDPTKLPPAPEDVAAPPASAATTASGLATKLLQKGTSDKRPTPTSKVRVHYTGWTTDGKAFDSSLARGRAAEFPLDRVIEGWREGILLMTVGEERRLWIPEALAYKGRPGRPAGMLVFDVNLIAVLD